MASSPVEGILRRESQRVGDLILYLSHAMPWRHDRPCSMTVVRASSDEVTLGSSYCWGYTTMGLISGLEFFQFALKTCVEPDVVAVEQVVYRRRVGAGKDPVDKSDASSSEIPTTSVSQV